MDYEKLSKEEPLRYLPTSLHSYQQNPYFLSFGLISLHLILYIFIKKFTIILYDFVWFYMNLYDKAYNNFFIKLSN